MLLDINHFPDWFTNIIFVLTTGVGVIVAGKYLIDLFGLRGKLKKKERDEILTLLKEMKDDHQAHWKEQGDFMIESRRNLIIIDTKVDAGHYAMNGAIDKGKFNELYDRKIRENELKHPELFGK